MRRRPEYRINTFDLNKNRGIGIRIPYNPDKVFNITYNTNEQIKSNLLNFMLTNRGERVFNPKFGADLRNLVFNQLTNVEEVRSSLENKISNYFPMIIINKLEFYPNFDRNSLKIVLDYSLNSKEETVTVEVV